MENPLTIKFSHGSLLIYGNTEYINYIKEYIKYDQRIGCYRSKALNYANIILALRKYKIPHADLAKDFNPIDISIYNSLTPAKHQEDAFFAWKNSGYKGIIIMPTGAGKTFLAITIINFLKRPALIVVPTIDLMQQWKSKLEYFFNSKIGILGGGIKDISNITVATYDSAVIHTEFIGNQFALAVFDECHHLPAATNQRAAEMNIAPYRLGLTATPERNDNGESVLYSLLGDISFKIDIHELKGKVLAKYVTKKIYLELNQDEKVEYKRNRNIYLDFLKKYNIDLRKKHGWQNFIFNSTRSKSGKEAFEAYQKQKFLARNPRSKFTKIWHLINNHIGERILIFTAENATAYKIGSLFFLPVITHKTKMKERTEFLDNFRKNIYPVLVTSKVLNEGVDVPEANVGIIFSGTASIREHVQRLGRILRPKEGEKQAILYELITKNTSEVRVSKQRRQHIAYTHRENI